MNKLLLVYLICILHGYSLYSQTGGVTSGAASYCSPSGGGFIGLSGYTGTIVDWQFTNNGGASWTNTGNILNQQGYSGLTQTTCYRAIVQVGVNIPDTSSVTCITIYQPSNGGTVSGGGVYCVGNGTLTLAGQVGSVLQWEYSVNNAATWTTVANSTNEFIYSGINENRLYRAVVRNSVYCSPANSNTVSVVISPAVGGSIDDITYCDVSGLGVMRLKDKIGNVTGWQYTSGAETNWIAIANTSDSLIYSALVNTISYRAIVNLPGCNTDTSSVGTVTINKTFAGNIVNSDTTVEYNDNNAVLYLKGNVGNVVEWQYASGDTTYWNPITNAATSFTYTNLTDTTYYRAIVRYESCLPDTTNYVAINVLPRRIAVVTNYFTPNGDGKNDIWFIKGINNFEDSEVFVYNSYGSEVYYTKNYQNDWQGTYNGKPLPDGTYYYIIKLYNPDEMMKGALTIIRGQ